MSANKRTTPALRDVELDYGNARQLAGLLDGEGYLTIVPSSGFAIIVSISNTSRELMDWLVTAIGGNFAPHKQARSPRPIYRWEATTRWAVPILRQVLPYLKVKRRSAELLLAFYSLRVQLRQEEGIFLASRYDDRVTPLLRELRGLSQKGLRREFVPPHQ